MTINGPEVGAVFHYPYLWKHAKRKRLESSKDRTVCLAMRREDHAGNIHLVLLPISDRAPQRAKAAIVISEIEKKRAGLDLTRPAFVHLDEYNVDSLPRSKYYSRNAKVFGRFGRAFTGRVAIALAAEIRSGSSTRIDRD
jgi:hypothetical protein